MRIIGIDPGLQRTGWAIVTQENHNIVSYIAGGIIQTSPQNTMAQRLLKITLELEQIIGEFQPQCSAIEEIFVNKNPESTLKLGMARAAAILAPARYNMAVFSYLPNKIKKTIVGSGHASKEQVIMMINQILPKANITKADTADAAAVAICHLQHKTFLG